MSAKNWTFTCNDQSGDLLTAGNLVDLAQGLPSLMDVSGISYVVYQLERGLSGTNHLQGYCQFSSRKTLRQVKDLLQGPFPSSHLEKAKGSPEQNRKYCTKEESRVDGPWEFGTMSKPGKRNDIQEFMDAQPLTEDEIYERFPHIIAKYPNFVRNIKRRRRAMESVQFVPRGLWQMDLLSYCQAPSHPREVRWYFDESGGSGKSTFCRQFGHGQRYVITGGKHADIYYAYNYEPYVFFDWPRSSEDTFPYGVVESFKNGYFLSTKYESAPVTFQPPIVIVFANFQPDMTKLSLDRWDIHTI